MVVVVVLAIDTLPHLKENTFVPGTCFVLYFWAWTLEKRRVPCLSKKTTRSVGVWVWTSNIFIPHQYLFSSNCPIDHMIVWWSDFIMSTTRDLQVSEYLDLILPVLRCFWRKQFRGRRWSLYLYHSNAQNNINLHSHRILSDSYIG